MMKTESGKYPILDTTGKIREWIKAGRGIKVWHSQEIGADRPDILTPGDTTQPPHWAYVGGDKTTAGGGHIVHESECAFYDKVGIHFDGDKYYEWTDTTMGWKAANRAIDGLPTSNGNAPLKMAYAYTVERVQYETVEKREDGRSLGVHFRVAVIEWCVRL